MARSTYHQAEKRYKLGEISEDIIFGLHDFFDKVVKPDRIENKDDEKSKIEAIGRFAGGLAHDLNNQMAIITSLIDMRFQQSELNGQVYQDFLQIRNAAERSSNLIRQILMFTRNYPQNIELLNFNDSDQ